MATSIPSGTVTFLFTDIEGSTKLWEQYPEPMKRALARHDGLLRQAIEGHGGHVIKTTGDGFHAAFQTGVDGVAAALAAQQALARSQVGRDSIRTGCGSALACTRAKPRRAPATTTARRSTAPPG